MYLGGRNVFRVRGVGRVRGVFYNGKHRKKDPSHFCRVRGAGRGGVCPYFSVICYEIYFEKPAYFSKHSINVLALQTALL